ncbi:N-acetyl-D-glucosamine ABC transport system, sugar-binding protein [Lachnospiraceae bacterium KM106-2]|nr:N-acetyl-D-glucosamine ABC transport system, sugar-binding protein [Lachnospiraceae bacterium KM106-2]
MNMYYLRRNKKIIVISLIFISILTFCYALKITNTTDTSSVQQTSSNSKKIILDYYIWDDEESYLSPVIEAYNTLQSSVTVKLHLLNSNYYDDHIDELLSSNLKIDLIGIKGISKMVQVKDKLVDLTSYIRNNDMDVTAYGSMFNDIAVDNKYYGIPTRNTSWALIYNKTLFDQAGLPYPKQMTWNEYRTLAKKLTKGSGKNKIYGGYWVPWCFNFAALQHSSYLIDDDLSYTRQSLELLNTFYNLDGSHMSYAQMDQDNVDVRSEFEAGKIAMMPQGEWIVNMLLQDQQKGLTKVNWDIAPIPVFKDQSSGITWGQYQFVSIPKYCAHPKEAFQFIQFLCGEEGAKIYAQHGIIHAYSNDEIKSLYLKTVGKKNASIFFQTKKVQEQLALSGYDDILESFKSCAKQYLLGKKSLDQVMNDFDRIRRKRLKSN